MGRPIAENLARAGLAVTGHTRTPARLGDDPLPFALAATAREAVEGNDVVLLAVPGIDDARAALAGAPLDGRTVALLATVDPQGSQEFGTELAAAGADYVEAPVAGSAVQAREASLLVLASAERREAVDALGPVFTAIARRTVWCGPPPAAMTIKLANNLVQIGLFAAFAEATRLVERSGGDLALFYDVLTSGALANRVLEAKTAMVLDGDLTAQAPLRHVLKDLRLIHRQAERAGLELPGVEADLGVFARAEEAGLGELDAMAILRVLQAQPAGS
jgi:3-hydroxyisobutyrate dehydrogenase-like beta-hydroxyacid dehydrogenase